MKMAEEFDYKLPDEQNEKTFENKLLDGHFNYFADINFWFMKQLPDREVRPSSMKNHIIGMSDKTYQKYLKLLEQLGYIHKERYGTYKITEPFIKCLQKYVFVIDAIYRRTFNQKDFEALMQKAKPKKEEIKVDEQIIDEVKKE